MQWIKQSATYELKKKWASLNEKFTKDYKEDAKSKWILHMRAFKYCEMNLNAVKVV